MTHPHEYLPRGQSGRYDVTATPPTIISKRAWALTCAKHGAYTGRAPNQLCPVCRELAKDLAKGREK